MRFSKGERGGIVGRVVAMIALLVITLVVYVLWAVLPNITKLLTENKQLRLAITNLTQEDTIGYAKVIWQGERDGYPGVKFTRLVFVETDRNNKSKEVLRKEYEIEGDVIHFDALIVKFGNKVVMDGKEKALYLWRRVYGDHTSPDQGFPIETEGTEPERYSGLLEEGSKSLTVFQRLVNPLFAPQKDKFWSEIWKLSHDKDKLIDIGVAAIYGNVVYNQMIQGKIYVFKISPNGNLFPEEILDPSPPPIPQSPPPPIPAAPPLPIKPYGERLYDKTIEETKTVIEKIDSWIPEPTGK
ncbi:MAG: hypothetical protein WC647_17315 [Desulfomonilaceae bacterium]|jgi:hypothetical protein